MARGPRRGRPRRTHRTVPRPARPLRPDHHARTDRSAPSAPPPHPPPPRTPPLLFTVATSGDEIARTLITRQAEEIALLAHVTLKRLNLLTHPTPVLLGGGVLTARDPLLHGRLTQLLAEHAPKAVPQVVTAPPVLGAALDALDRAGAEAGAYGRVRGWWG